MTMPDKIYAAPTNYPDDFGNEWCKEKVLGTNPYIRHALYEALEAENKMLAEAINALCTSKDGRTSHEIVALFLYNSMEHAEAIALAQRIGGKNDISK